MWLPSNSDAESAHAALACASAGSNSYGSTVMGGHSSQFSIASGSSSRAPGHVRISTSTVGNPASACVSSDSAHSGGSFAALEAVSGGLSCMSPAPKCAVGACTCLPSLTQHCMLQLAVIHTRNHLSSYSHISVPEKGIKQRGLSKCQHPARWCSAAVQAM